MPPKSAEIRSSDAIDAPAPSGGGAERRAHTRHALALVGALSLDGERFVPCHVRDFCLEGMLLAVDERSQEQLVAGSNPITSGSALALRFSASLDGETREYLARVRVARSTGDGFGVYFEGDNADAIWQLRRLAGDLEAEHRESLDDERRARTVSAPMPVEEALNAGELLELARERLDQFLVKSMAALFQDAEQRLVAGANTADTDSNQGGNLEAMQQVQEVRDAIETAYLGAVAREFATMVNPGLQPEPEPAPGAQELALVDTGSFDDWVTTKNIVSKAEGALREVQYELEQRLTQLVHSPIDEENNPIGLAPLCLGFHDAMQGLGASGHARRTILESFEHTFVKALKGFYGEINALFANKGHLPDIEHDHHIVKSPDSLGEVDEASDAEDDSSSISESSDFDSDDEIDSNASPDIVARTPTMLPPLKLGSAFQAAGNLINMQRSAEAGGAAGAGDLMQGLETWAPGQATLEQHKELLESLSILQRSPRFANASEVGPIGLRQTLTSTWRSAGVEASPDHHMMLDIVSNLIDAIMDDPFVGDEVKTRVRRLAVPVLKVAFQDPQFFENQQHPARQLLDNLGRLDPESTERFTDIVDPVVNGIIASYEDDPGIFAKALTPLKTAVSRQRKAFQENLERLVSERETQQEFIKSRKKDSGESDETQAKTSASPESEPGDKKGSEWEHWLSDARRCKPGDVLSIEGQDGKRKKLTLAWVSDDKGTFVLVDSLGKKAMSMTTQELAMHMKRGSAVAEDIANMALTDRGTYRMLRSLHEQLSRKASHDQITDVLTRKEFEGRLDELITDAVRNASGHVMYALDVEGLQQIVQKAGTKVAVELLRKVAQLLEKSLANRGAVARLGPTRFGVLLHDFALESGQEIVERQREIIAKARCMWKGESFPLTASAAIVEITDMTDGVEATLQAVESALVRAAEAGGNQVKLTGTVHDPLQSQGLRNAGKTTVLDMLNMDSLQLRCQRVVPLAEDDSRLPHYEILLGVRKDEGTVALPADFIRAAVRSDEMQMVDRWVINSVFAWISENQDRANAADGYSINLSTNSLSDDGILEFVLKQFSESMVPPAKIIFEFPESAATANVSLTTDFVTTLKSYGCRFAIDDFGMADTSFSYLNSLPVDFVKIDGKLVVDILSSAKDLAVVRSINEIGHLLGKQTIAEFVENDEILARLRDLGVDFAQGYGIEKPGLLSSL
jgi:diguanylate cyclase (GGDEF)-like protein